MPVIYFIRHGQTDWNAERRIQGQRDIPINALGREQAARNGRVLRDLADPATLAFLSSPLIRTRQTMEIVRREMGLPADGYGVDDRLRELNYGDWQGWLASELALARPDEVAARERDPWNMVPPGAGAESYAVLIERILPVFTALEGDTVVVSHGGLSKVLRKHHLGLTPHEMFRLDAPQDQIMRIDGNHISWH